jgi:hypothetical protein
VFKSVEALFEVGCPMLLGSEIFGIFYPLAFIIYAFMLSFFSISFLKNNHFSKVKINIYCDKLPSYVAMRGRRPL